VRAIMFDPRLLFVAVVWAVNFAVVKYALAAFTPLSFTTVRFILSSLFLLLVMLLGRESFAIERRDRGALVRLGFIGITMYNLLFMYGLEYTTASNSALFISSSPLFAEIVLSVTEKKRFGIRITSGLLLCTLGVFLIIRSKTGGVSFSRQDVAGDLLTLCAAFFWALYTVMARPLVQKYAPVKVTAYSMAAGALLLLPIGFSDLIHQSWSAIPIKSWIAFSFSTFLSGGVAFTLWYQGVKRIGVMRTIVYHYLVPFIAVLFAGLFLNERITVLQVLGGGMILLGVSLVQRGNESRTNN
jgi:drug/metabolite transporter (DMT)-like permease